MKEFINAKIMSSQGMIGAILVAFYVGLVYCWFLDKDIRIKMPDSVPSSIANSFSALIPAVVIIFGGTVVYAFFNKVLSTTMIEWLYAVVQTPLQGITDSLGGIIVISLAMPFLWFFGIHGTTIVNSIVVPFMRANYMENQAILAAGKALTLENGAHIVTEQFFDNILMLSGTGIVGGIVIYLVFFAKSKQSRQLGKLAAIPNIFNINEPVLFGVPIVFNPIMAIPFFLVPLTAALVSYFAIYTGLERYPELLAPAYTAEDIRRNEENGKMSAVLTMEDGVAVHGSLDRLKSFYDLGVRALSLTWNFKNCFGSPNSDDRQTMAEGLTAFGKDAVAYMQELGMLVDVSHLSDGGFYDVAALCKKPFIASHSNCRELSPHSRNLTDDMLRTLAAHGGVAGVNFSPAFLNRDVKSKDSTVDRIAAMMAHMRNIAGIDVVGIGSDFDGIHGSLEISDSQRMPLLVRALENRGFTQEEIDKITHKNVLRVMRECL